MAEGWLPGAGRCRACAVGGRGRCLKCGGRLRAGSVGLVVEGEVVVCGAAS